MLIVKGSLGFGVGLLYKEVGIVLAIVVLRKEGATTTQYNEKKKTLQDTDVKAKNL